MVHKQGYIYSLAGQVGGCINCLDFVLAVICSLLTSLSMLRSCYSTQSLPHSSDQGGLKVVVLVCLQLESSTTLSLPSSTAYQVLKQGSKAPDMLLNPSLKLFIG